MKGIIDHFEGDYAVIEVDGQTQDVSKLDISSTVKVGDVVLLVAGVWVSDITETEKREQQIKKLMNDVWKD
jgi:hydrogenase maturation factor